MSTSDSRVPWWGACLAGVVILAVCVTLVVVPRSHRSLPPVGTNHAVFHAPRARPPVATNQVDAKMIPGAEVAALIGLLRQWREHHPVYHLMMETKGGEAVVRTEVFRFRNEAGRMVNRSRSQVAEPVNMTFWISAEGDKIQAYFPLSNQAVDMNLEQQQQRFWELLGWTGPVLDESALLALAKAAYAETGPDYMALTMMFSGRTLQMPPAAGDLFLTIRMDGTGRTLGLEQLTLAGRIASTITYVSEENSTVKAKAPEIPPTARKTQKSFQEVLQEEMTLARDQPAKTI